MSSSSEEIDDLLSRFYPILPHSLENSLNLLDWSAEGNDDGQVRMVQDAEIGEEVVEIDNPASFQSTFLSFPTEAEFLGTAMPLLTLQLKPLKRKLSLEVDIEDTKGNLRTLRCCNAQTVVRVSGNVCSLPLQLESEGWNRVVLDLPALCRTAFEAQYQHAVRIRIYANCRLRRIFFSLPYRTRELPAFLRPPLLLSKRSKRTVAEEAPKNPPRA